MLDANKILATKKYVDDLINNCSPSIITTSNTGKAFSIPDSSESVIRGLTAYGESVQDGAPTPDSPVEIVNIENPVINIGNQTVTVPYTFRGLKNTSGDWVARDELRVGDGKVEIVRNVGIVELKGTETFTLLDRSEDYKLFYTAISNYQRYYGLCNYYKVVASGATAGQCCLSDRLYFGDSRFTAVADFKSWLSTQYSAGNPVVYYYSFETAAVEDITATEAGQALLALKTNYPNTSVISDIDLNLTYRADTKNYIDNKIAALTALTLEG